MRASAPGKIVLSGAYAVLRGTRAIVTAADARVFADSSRAPEFVAREVSALFELLGERIAPGTLAPHIDASALRHDGKKLGLGSSAAITVASLLALAPELSRDELLRIARDAHRKAQGGGSGIDVFAATFGGTYVVTSNTESLSRERVSLPSSLEFEVWAIPNPATTSDFVRRVFALESSDSRSFSRLFSEQCDAAEATADALLRGHDSEFVHGLKRQAAALRALGSAAGVPIVTPEVETLALLCSDDAVLLPAGAGGGDIVVHVGPAKSAPEFRNNAEKLGLFKLALALDASGARLESETA